jgi:hypothetical protein
VNSISRKITRPLIAGWTLLLTLLAAMPSAFAHQPGVIDSHITVGHTTVSLVYTLPSDWLNKLEDGQNFTPQTALPLVSKSFMVFDDEKPCQIIKSSTSPLATIKSEQFFITWTCNKKLGRLVITDSLADNEDYKNFTRFSMAGQHKQVVFTQRTPNHEFPIGTLLTLWNKTLVDEPDTNVQPTITSTELSWGNFSQSSHYLPIGLTHILFGWDHILFLIGLLLLVTHAKALLVLVTCFTLSHSVALALSVLDIINLSTAIIEPLIALSIVYVGAQNIHKLHQLKTNKNSSGTHDKYQWMVITAFGFIHGFGFSFLLKEMGHTNDLLPSLLFFNLGVEAGQLLIVIPLFLLLNKVPLLWQRDSLAANGAVISVQPGMIFCKQTIALMTCFMGVYWLMERTVMG